MRLEQNVEKSGSKETQKSSLPEHMRLLPDCILRQRVLALRVCITALRSTTKLLHRLINGHIIRHDMITDTELKNVFTSLYNSRYSAVRSNLYHQHKVSKGYWQNIIERGVV